MQTLIKCPILLAKVHTKGDLQLLKSADPAETLHNSFIFTPNVDVPSVTGSRPHSHTLLRLISSSTSFFFPPSLHSQKIKFVSLPLGPSER